MIRTLGAASLAALLGLVALNAGPAEAAKKKKPAAAKVAYQKVDARAIGELMGPYTFGMSSKDVLGVLAKQIDARYADKIKNTEDVYTQDRLRREKQGEIDRIKKTYVDFKGAKTGWDVSIIDDQFAHGTDESMLIFWENQGGQNQRRFFFFHNGQLYKMFIALSSDMFKGEQRSFDYFQSIMEKRYGTGNVVTSKGRDGVERKVAIDWRTPTHHVQALDKLEFHGAFCLVIAEPGTEARVAELRASTQRPARKNAVIDSVIQGQGADADGPSLDENKGAVDAILRDE